MPSGFFTIASLIIGFLFLVRFALACGCVIGPRVEIGLPEWLGIALSKLGLKSTWAIIKRRGESHPADTLVGRLRRAAASYIRLQAKNRDAQAS